MEIVYDDAMLADYLARSTEINADHPVLVDRFLDNAIEIDVDAIYDGEELFLAGVMEHIEEAGIHSGDSACVLPPMTLTSEEIDRIRDSTLAIAKGVGVHGLLNVQYALLEGVLYVLEANPRASRTVPFVSKATAVPVAKAAARVMVGETIARLRAEGILPANGDGGTLPKGAAVAVKEAVLPFGRFHGVDTLLGPEMRSTGEVMGFDDTFGVAFAKSQEAAFSGGLPTTGTAFVSLADRDKAAAIEPLRRLTELGFQLFATSGTALALGRHGVHAEVLRKQHEGRGIAGEATTVDAIMAGEIDLIVNTPYGVGPRVDGYEIRTAAVIKGVPSITTVQGLAAAVQGIESLRSDEPVVRSLQEHAGNLNRLRSAQAASIRSGHQSGAAMHPPSEGER
jgi:carbamoyl-phosphate synthase large subunit